MKLKAHHAYRNWHMRDVADKSHYSRRVDAAMIILLGVALIFFLIPLCVILFK